MRVFSNIIKNIKVYNIFICFIIVFILFFLISNLLSYSFIFSDDADNILVESFKKIFINKTYANSLPIPSVLEKLFGIYIPHYILKIHPSDFKSEYFSYIEAFLIIIFSFIPLKIMFLNKSDNIIYKLPLIMYLFIISFYMYSLQKSNLMLFTYDGFFRLNMPIFLFLLFFIYIIKTVNTYKECPKKLSDKERYKAKYCNKAETEHLNGDDEPAVKCNTGLDYIIISILTVLCCLSNELTCVTLTLGTIIYTCLSLFNRMSKKGLFLLLYLLILSTGIAIFLFNLGAFTRKSPHFILNLNYFIGIVKIIPVFIKEYIKYMFINHFIGYIFLIAQIIILVIKTEERNSLNIVISYLSGLLIFFFALIGIGQYKYLDYINTFWIAHPDIQTMHEMILLSFNLYLFSLILKNKILKNSFLYIIFAVFIGCSGFYIYKNISYYDYCRKSFLKPLRETHYKAEKIIRLSNLKNKTIYLDSQIFENPNNWSLFYDKEEKEQKYSIAENIYILFLNNIGGNIKQNIIFTDKETVEKKFTALGGIFTEEELNNIKFSKLSDEKFLLNKKF